VTVTILICASIGLALGLRCQVLALGPVTFGVLSLVGIPAFIVTHSVASATVLAMAGTLALQVTYLAASAIRFMSPSKKAMPGLGMISSPTAGSTQRQPIYRQVPDAGS
jgi:hypothetical protein